MIHPEDVKFHTPKDVGYDWAETNFFSIYLPEPNIAAWVYTVARPGVGAFVADVEAINCISTQSIDAIYVDFQQHLPMPIKLQDYSLPNGLSLKTHNEPRDYHIRYQGNDDTEFDWYVKGIMEPFDIHDPSMDPLASADPTQSGFGSAYANHFDMTAHISGTAKIRGHKFDVDCVTVMDHSWGPRNERLMRNMGWINACFGEDYSVQAIYAFNPLANDWAAFELAHGYALVDGKVRGLISGKLRAVRHGQFAIGYEMRVTDIDHREHVLIGTPVAQHPWSCYSNSHAKLSMVRWFADGREGYGQAQENWAMDRLTGLDFKAGRN
jgi:hypothetical protein